MDIEKLRSLVPYKDVSLPQEHAGTVGSLAATIELSTVSSGGVVSLPVHEPALYKFDTHTFTTAGVIGREGPTLSQVRSAYGPEGWWNDFLSMEMQGIQIWTVPRTGWYRVECAGASSRNNAYTAGAIMRGDFLLAKEETLNILCGQSGHLFYGGGAGGSFLFKSPGIQANHCLIAAGGSGGIIAGTNINGWTGGHGTTSSQGRGGSTNNTSGGKDGWHGGMVHGPSRFYVSGGAGFLRDGLGGSTAPSNGGLGAERNTYYTYSQGIGGFGGGGHIMRNVSMRGGAGGGGYSGGGGAYSTANFSGIGTGHIGGGGGSINRGTNQQNESGANAGSGYVKITWLGE